MRPGLRDWRVHHLASSATRLAHPSSAAFPTLRIRAGNVVNDGVCRSIPMAIRAFAVPRFGDGHHNQAVTISATHHHRPWYRVASLVGFGCRPSKKMAT